MWLFIGGRGPAIFTPLLLLFFSPHAAGEKCGFSRNTPSASLLPSVQKHQQFAARCSRLPDHRPTDQPAATPAHLFILFGTLLLRASYHFVQLLWSCDVTQRGVRKQFQEESRLGFEKTKPVWVEEWRWSQPKWSQISSLHLTHHSLTPSSQLCRALAELNRSLA